MTRLPNWLFVILSCFVTVLSFNLDVDNLVKYRGRSGSMFGFTVAQHSYQTQNSVIVGAPEDQTDQAGVTKGGAVYRCHPTGDNCERIRFDRNGDNKDQYGNPIDSKSNQWFGATLTSSNGSVLACAPRYVYTQPTSAEERRDPVGTCWLAKDQLNSSQEFSPCRNRDWGYHRHGHCQAGLGAALSKDGGRLYIGAPGSCFWQGQVHSVAATTKLPFVPPKVIIIDEEGKIHSQNTYNRADVISSSEGPSTDDDSYLGYSVTSGRFEGGREKPAPSDIAVGVPKGERLNGKVVLFTYNMTHIRNITGEQLGAYFGYAMAACNIDGDSYDDLIVGAPMYTEEGNDEGFYETGRIYVFYAGHSDGKHIRDGDKNNRARFGHSIACLGDVNRDGYNDFAVGAPYGKDGEGGAVYIYHGSKDGVREKYSQVIKAEEIPGNPLTFGFSVAGGVDMDRNQYPDLSVGAYESNQAFLFKARPVVEMHSSVTFESESKQISLEERNCTLRDRTKVPCVKLDVCLRYEGLGVDSKLPFEIQVLLDARKPKNPRLAFWDQEEGRSSLNETLFLEKGRNVCKSYWVYLKNNIKDKLTSLDAELWYSLINNQNTRVARSLTPVLNANENLSAKDTLAIQKNCGRDNICIPDLRLIARPSVDKYVLGSGKRLEIEVEVQNEGEDAFESTFELQVPSGLNYVKIERKDESEREIPVQCSPPSFNNNYTLHCDIGNPLPREKLVKFLVLLQPYHQNTMNSTYDFSMVVNSTNPEKSYTGSDNHIRFAVPIWVVTELAISGSSRPVDVYYNSSQYVTDDETKITRESQIGPQVAHLYTITNRGPSEFLKAKATILWPSNTLTGEPLLYLLEEPETSGNIECHVEDDEYNIKKVKIERRGKSFFDAEPGTSSAWYSSDYETDADSSSSSGGASATRTSSSSSSWSSSSSSGSRAQLSREERLRFEEEERRREEEAVARETGDGSHRHGERVKASNQGKNHYSRNGGRLESDSYSSGSETRDRSRTDYSSSRTVPVDGSRVREEHRSYSSSSWTGQESPVTKTKSSERTSKTKGGKTETRWREEEDGVVKSGSSVVEHDGVRRGGASGGVPVGGEIESSYESSSTRSSSSRTRGGGVGNTDRRVSWRVEGDGAAGIAGSRTAEERRTEWNTTWASGGRPVTSEHSSWRKEQDGAVVGSTEHTRTYEGDYTGSRTGGVSGFDDRSSSSGRRVGWRVDGEGRNREDGGAVVVDERTSETTSRRRGHGGAGVSRTSEERRSEWTREDGGTAVVEESSSGAASRRHGPAGASATRTSEERRSEWSREEGGSGVVGESISGTASRRRGQGAAGASRTAGERRSEWNTTWISGGRPVTSEHTSWRKEQDGAVVGAGDHRTTYGGEVSGANRNIQHGDRSSSSNRNVSWRVEGEGMTREGGTVLVDDASLEVASRRRHQGGVAGSRTAEEKRTEWNTTWSSGGRPVTSEHTSWRKEQDGAVVGSGDHTRTYEGTADRDKVELERRLKEQLDRRITSVASTHGSSSADSEIDQNLIAGGGGGTTYKKEWEEHYNTTWGTSTGGKPVTVAKTKWTIEEDGAVKTGGDSKTYEGLAPGTAGTTLTFPSGTSQGVGRGHSSNKHYESSHHESRTQSVGGSGLDGDRTESSHKSEVSQSGSAHTGGSERRHHFSTENEDIDLRVGGRAGESGGVSGVSSSGSHHHRAESSLSEEELAAQGHRKSSLSESEHRVHGHRSGSESGRRTHSHGAEAESSGSDYTETERRTQGHRTGEAHYGSERRTHGSGSSSVASSVGESSGVSSAFDLGAVARGPGDGKARTYVTDLGILQGGASSGSSAASGSRTVHFSAAGEGDSGRHHSGTRERHYSFGSDTGARDEGSDSYSSSVHGYGGRSSGGSSYSSGARYATSGRTTGSRNIEGDPDLDPDYESRKAGSASSSSHSYSRSYSSRDGTYEAGVSDDDHRTITNQDDRQGFRHYRRDRRQAEDYTDSYYDYDEEETSKKCSGPVKCTRIVCNIGALKKDQEVHVAIRSRLWLATIKKIAPHVETVLGSEMTAKVTLLPTIGRPSQKTMTKNSTEIKTRIMTEPLSQPDVVPLWIVVLSAVSGALILMLLVYVLYKLGFFKRNRPEPSTGSEKTPLNRNGHYQGDEPL
uniref:Integrin alpha-PS2 n=1 Tax=Lygus hesperus TaxID=30085 RepID=A0A146ME75_LYGHE